MNKQRVYICFLFDVLAAIIVWVLFYMYRRVTNDFVLFGDNVMFSLIPNYNLAMSLISFPFIAVFFHYLSGYYNSKAKRSRLVDFFATFTSTFFISLFIYFVMLVDDVVVNITFYYRAFLILWGMFFVITYIFRSIQTFITLHRLRKGLIPNNVLIVGTGEGAKRISNIIQRNSKRDGQKIVGYIRIRDGVFVDKNKVLGRLFSIEDIVHSYNVNSVIIAVDDIDNEMIFEIVNRLIKCGVDVKLSPRLFEVVMGHVSITDIASEPYVDITSSSMPAWQQSFKRVFDILVSSVSMLILLPMYIYLAIRVKLGSKGPVFYKQERIGYGGEPFYIYKFRTMYVDSEIEGPQLSKVHDKRITKFGQVMRKYRLDELPQFWNIIKGDMSIVGPRPERRYFIDKIEVIAPYYCLVYRVQPGLLSWGPIKIGYSDTVEKMVERLKYDIIYMDNMSIQTDIKILFYSVGVIIHGQGQ